MKKAEKLKEIADQIRRFTASPLYKYRITNNYHPVPGEGNPNAFVMFIGEAPGEREAKTGKPFCGAAGKVLDELFFSVGLKREDVFITSLLKDRPPGNRDPLPTEIRAYAPFLDEQINIIKPKVIVPLGRFATNYIMQKFLHLAKVAPIGKIHGKVFKAETHYGFIFILPMYHPAVVLYRNQMKKLLLYDFKILSKLIKHLKQASTGSPVNRLKN